MRTLLMIGAATAVLALPAAAQAPDAMKVRATYERLCTGDAPASVSTCQALRAEVDKAGVPGTTGWSGLMIGARDDGPPGVRIYAVDPAGPAAQAGLRTGDILLAVDGQATADQSAAVKQLAGLAGQVVAIRVRRGETVLNLPVKLAEAPKPKPIRNAERTSRGAYSLWSGAALTVDRIRVGELFHGILEDSDASSDWGKREDCIEVVEPAPGRNLAAFLTPNGGKMRVYVQYDRCGPGVGSSTWAATADGKAPVNVNFATIQKRKIFLYVSGASSEKPYTLAVRDLTPRETIAWKEAVRQQQIAEQQRREAEARAQAERGDSGLFGALAMGFGAAMAGGSPEMVMGAAMKGAELTTTNEMTRNVLAGQGDAMIQSGFDRLAQENALRNAQAAEAARQRQQAAARAAAEANAAQLAQQQQAARDRQTLTNVLANSRVTYEQRLRDAAAKGDEAAQQFYAQKLVENAREAERFGLGSQVRHVAEAQLPPPPKAPPRPNGFARTGSGSVAEQIADQLNEGGSLGRKPPPQLALDSQLPKGERMCNNPAFTKEWTSGIALTLDEATRDYNAAKARPCANGGGSISPMQCSKMTKAFGVTMVGGCTATISCPARTVKCTPTVSAQ